jgi:hypothetical protein
MHLSTILFGGRETNNENSMRQTEEPLSDYLKRHCRHEICVGKFSVCMCVCMSVYM